MWENGKADLDMEKEQCNGQMEVSIRVNGVMEEHTEKVFSTIRKERYMKGIGFMIKHRDMVLTLISMVLHMRENGIKIYNMVKEKRNGLMVLHLRENTEMEKRTD